MKIIPISPKGKAIIEKASKISLMIQKIDIAIFMHK